MTNQFTAIIERDRGWFVAHCVEIPGVTGRGPTLDAACGLGQNALWLASLLGPGAAAVVGVDASACTPIEMPLSTKS